MKGTWSYKDNQKQQHFHFFLTDKLQGEMEIHQEGQEEFVERVEIDLKQKEIKNLDESAKTIISFKPEAVDNKIADLCFFI